LTRWLTRVLRSNRSRPEHIAVAGITVAQYGIARLTSRRAREEIPNGVAGWLREVDTCGYCVIPEFYDAATCARCVAELERLFDEYPEYVHRKSDMRLFGVEAGSNVFRAFAEDPRLLMCAECVLGEATVNAFTLGARIDYAPANRGSGEGWHRDAFLVAFKAILYLSDVEPGRGPFQLIADSEKLPRLATDIVQARLGLAQDRIDDEQVKRLLAREPGRLRTFTGKAGTLLLVNTSSIHRGQPIEHDHRYVLTNYYVPRKHAGAEMDAHFAPVLRATPSDTNSR
jgi:hypothetical protein